MREAEFLFALSRRHGLPFSVMAIRARENGVGPSDTIPGRSTLAIGGAEERIESTLASALRGTDVVVRWGGAGRYAVFCSGTDADGVAELSRRVRRDVPGLTVDTGCASFGKDGLTLEDLVDRAWQALPSDSSGTPGSDRPPTTGGLRVIDHGFGRGRVRRSLWRRALGQRVKRAFDVGIIVATSPLWLATFALTAAAIKLSDPRAPILFVQMRTGRGGHRFPMYKFRTMVPNAEALKHQLRKQNELAWPDFKIKSDPRVTRLGRILRKTSLDELPQLVNVLRGEMSLVGPRPTSFEAATYAPWQTARLDVLPGVTGLWQVEGRASARFDERIRIELDYIERQSLLLDLWILIRTVPTVVQMRGGH